VTRGSRLSARQRRRLAALLVELRFHFQYEADVIYSDNSVLRKSRQRMADRLARARKLLES